jgi:hypothetical protein
MCGGNNMNNPPKMLNVVGAAKLLDRSEVTIVKHVESGVIKCAWVFSEEEGRLIRRPEGENTKRLNFFYDELIQYLEKKGDTFVTNFTTPIVLNNNRPIIFNSEGAAKFLGLTKTRVIKLFQDGRMPGYGYNSEGVLAPRDHESRAMARHITIYFEEDLLKVERRPRARPEVEPKTAQQRYLKKYYQENKDRLIARSRAKREETNS